MIAGQGDVTTQCRSAILGSMSKKVGKHCTGW